MRRHLDQLLDEGILEAREPRATGHRGRGRPAKVFALTEAGRDRFDQAYDDLAVQAIRFLAETGGEEAVRVVRRPSRRARSSSASTPSATARPDLAPVEALAQVFTDEGYAAAVRDLPVGHQAGQQLCQQHCPVSHVAHEFPELCEAETAAIGRMLGRHVQRLATIAHGDGVCTTCIPQTPTTATKERVTR